MNAWITFSQDLIAQMPLIWLGLANTLGFIALNSFTSCFNLLERLQDLMLALVSPGDTRSILTDRPCNHTESNVR